MVREVERRRRERHLLRSLERPRSVLAQPKPPRPLGLSRHYLWLGSPRQCARHSVSRARTTRVRLLARRPSRDDLWRRRGREWLEACPDWLALRRSVRWTVGEGRRRLRVSSTSKGRPGVRGYVHRALVRVGPPVERGCHGRQCRGGGEQAAITHVCSLSRTRVG